MVHVPHTLSKYPLVRVNDIVYRLSFDCVLPLELKVFVNNININLPLCLAKANKALVSPFCMQSGASYVPDFEAVRVDLGRIADR